VCACACAHNILAHFACVPMLNRMLGGNFYRDICTYEMYMCVQYNEYAFFIVGTVVYCVVDVVSCYCSLSCCRLLLSS